MIDNYINTKKSKHSLMARIFHWGFVLLFAYGLIKQVQDLNQLEEVSLLRFEVFFAILFVLLLFIRFVYMKKTQKSFLPKSTPKIQKFAAKTVHYMMYITLAIIPLTGLVIGFLYWIGLKSSFIMDGINSIHETSVLVMYWLIAIHISAAIFHRFRRDGVWSSMVPLFKEKIK